MNDIVDAPTTDKGILSNLLREFKGEVVGNFTAPGVPLLITEVHAGPLVHCIFPTEGHARGFARRAQEQLDAQQQERKEAGLGALSWNIYIGDLASGISTLSAPRRSAFLAERG